MKKARLDLQLEGIKLEYVPYEKEKKKSYTFSNSKFVK